MTQSRKKNRSSFPPASSVRESSRESRPLQSTIRAEDKRPMRWDLVAIFLAISIGGTYLAIATKGDKMPPRYSYKVLRTFPHDKTAFTQGLLLHDGFLWESTGRKGSSSFRKVELESGEVLQQVKLGDAYFGEGLAYHNGLFYQLTWRENVCFVYNEDMELVNQFPYEGEGWGLTSNGEHLIMSDGTSALRFLDPDTFQEVRRVNVRIGGRRVEVLNELEFVGPKLYANVWTQDYLYEIDPKTGAVTAIIDLSGLWPQSQRPNEGVLNGIAFNRKTEKLIVTGKYAPSLWEIQIVPKN
jgi:glutamine cyclotransferase